MSPPACKARKLHAVHQAYLFIVRTNSPRSTGGRTGKKFTSTMCSYCKVGGTIEHSTELIIRTQSRRYTHAIMKYMCIISIRSHYSVQLTFQVHRTFQFSIMVVPPPPPPPPPPCKMSSRTSNPRHQCPPWGTVGDWCRG